MTLWFTTDVIAAVFVISGAGRAVDGERAPEAAPRPAAGTDQHAAQTHRHHTPAYNLVHSRSNGYTAHTARHGSVAAVHACQQYLPRFLLSGCCVRGFAAVMRDSVYVGLV